MSGVDSSGAMERVTDALDRPFRRYLLRHLPFGEGERMVKFIDEANERRARRADEWLQTLSRVTGMTQDQILDRALSSEELTETVAAALTAAVSSPDADKRRSLARVLAPALTDDASIDQASYLTRIIATLEPVDVRVLGVLARTRSELYDETERRAASRSEPTMFTAVGWPQLVVTKMLNSEPVVVEVVLWRLQAQGLAVPGTLAFDDGSRGWMLTDAGRQILTELENVEGDLD